MKRRKKGGTNRRHIALNSGGSITLSYDFDLFELTPEDRMFVNGVIDSLRSYEKTQAASTNKGSTGKGSASTRPGPKGSADSVKSGGPAPKGSRRTKGGGSSRDSHRVGANDS